MVLRIPDVHAFSADGDLDAVSGLTRTALAPHEANNARYAPSATRARHEDLHRVGLPCQIDDRLASIDMQPMTAMAPNVLCRCAGEPDVTGVLSRPAILSRSVIGLADLAAAIPRMSLGQLLARDIDPMALAMTGPASCVAFAWIWSQGSSGDQPWCSKGTHFSTLVQPCGLLVTTISTSPSPNRPGLDHFCR
jgi:hypothetical protein